MKIKQHDIQIVSPVGINKNVSPLLFSTILNDYDIDIKILSIDIIMQLSSYLLEQMGGGGGSEGFRHPFS